MTGTGWLLPGLGSTPMQAMDSPRHHSTQLQPLALVLGPTYAHVLFAVLQVPLQQAEPSWHDSPAQRQAHCPLVQQAEQHSEPLWHGNLVGLQTGSRGWGGVGVGGGMGGDSKDLERGGCC